MKRGDKVCYLRHHHIKQPATWLCWITRGDRRLAMVKIKGGHRHIEVSPSDVEIGRAKNEKVGYDVYFSRTHGDT